MRLAKQIITQRIKLNLSQKELADKSKLNIKTIQQLENAESNSNIYTLEKISKGLEMNISDLLKF